MRHPFCLQEREEFIQYFFCIANKNRAKVSFEAMIIKYARVTGLGAAYKKNDIMCSCKLLQARYAVRYITAYSVVRFQYNR